MSHERSETVQRDGRWVNVFGADTPQAGQVLPGEQPHDTMEAAVEAARERSATFEREDNPDASSEYAAAREERGLEAEKQEMLDWMMKERGGAVPLKVEDPAAGLEVEPLEDPFPTDRKPPPAQSTTGKVLRSMGEVPKAIALGMDSAVRNATDWAVGPLVKWLNENVANLEVPVEPLETTTGKITKSLSEFLTGFIPALKGMKALGVAGKVTQPVAASAIADFAVRDPHEARLSNLWQEMGLPANVLTDYLAADPSDGAVEGRLKSAAEAVLTGTALDGLLHGARMLRAAKHVSKLQGDELSKLKAKYGELDDETFAKALGDPSKPMLVTKVEPVPPAVGKVREGLEATAPLQSIDELVGVPKATSGAPRSAIPVAQEDFAQDLGQRWHQPPKFDPDKDEFVTLWHVTDADSAASIRAEGFVPGKVVGPFQGFAPKHKGTYGWPTKERALFEAQRSAESARGPGSAAGVGTGGNVGDFAIIEVKVPKSHWKNMRPDEDAGGTWMTSYKEGSAVYEGKVESDWVQRVLYDKNASVDPVELLRKGAPTAKEAADLVASAERRAPDLEALAQGVEINWGRVGTEVDVQALMADMAGRFKGHIDETRRGVMSHEATTKLADEMDMTVAQLLARRKGQPLSAEEGLAARRIWAASGENLTAAAQRAAAANAGQLDQYAFRKALATHYAVQAEVIGARTETARALSAWRIPAGGGVERARAIEQALSAMGGPEASQELAKRLAILAQHANPRALAKFAEKGFAAKSFDVVREVWVNGLLSSPATHFVNMMSNTAVMFSQALERGVAARIGQLRGAQGDVVAPGEALAMTYALVSGVRDAWTVAAKSFKSGETGWALNKVELPRQHALESSTWNVGNDTALGRTIDLLGTTARVPSRFLGAEDEFFKSIGYRMEVHAQALRQATGEGLKGEAMGRRMAQLVLEPPEHIRIAAADAALYNTFTQQSGAFGQVFMKLRERVPVVSFVLPFIRTPVNIARYTFERSPFAPLVGQWRDDIAAGGARADIALARMATGSTIMLSALDWADSGIITGSGPKDPGEREAWMRQGGQPYSIRLGGYTISFNRADPFGALLGFAADVSDAARRGEMNEDDLDEWQEVVAMATTAVAQVAINKQYLRGISDVFEYMADPTRHGEGYINNLVASFLPFTALTSAVERVGDPTIREATNPWEAISAKVTGLSDKLPPRLDLWGAEIKAESGLGKAYDFFSPMQARKVKPEPIDTEILKLAPLAAMDNVAGSAPRRIGKRTGFMGVQVNFKEWKDAYVDYVRLAGNELKHPAWDLGAKDFLNAVVTGKHELAAVYNADTSDETKIRFINTAVGQFRALAQQAIMNDPKHAEFAAYVQKTREDRQKALLPLSAR